MRAKPVIGIVVAVLVTLTSGAFVAPTTASDGCKYFSETGHYVCGQYLSFFRAKGGLEIFGFPLTESFEDPTHAGLRVQYFQRARMEIHPDGSAGRILLGLLVDELGHAFPPADPDQIPSTNSASHHYFPETQHVVSHAFLEAFREKGGLEIFGYPRSEFIFEDGQIVQYFQRARMEWDRDKPAGSQIRLANLGEVYLERFGVPGQFDDPVPPPARDKSSPSPVTAEDENATCTYYAETGHHVCDHFLNFFKAKGDTQIFGFPLTEAFEDPAHAGLRVQYFQRARMELHPSDGGSQVLLGLLADELGYTFPPAAPDQIPSTNAAGHHYFPETGHVVSHAFLDAFRDMGGLEIFGYPRSELMYEGGHIVQYFQRARMEWRPGNSDGFIGLTNLGEIYLERFEVPDEYRKPQPPARFGSGSGDSQAGGQPTVIDLDVTASVQHPVTGPKGSQTVYVHVHGQQGQAIEGASVTLRVGYPGREKTLALPPTNARGFTKGTFELLPAPPGQKIVVDVIATYANLSRTTQTSFLRWQ